MDLGAIFSQLGAFVLVVIISFSGVALLASSIRFHMLSHRMKHASVDDANPGDLLQLRIVQQLGAFHQTPVPFVLLLLEPDALAEIEGERHARLMDAFYESARKAVREGDFTILYEGRWIGMLLPGDVRGAMALAKRLQDALSQNALRTGDDEPLVKTTVSIGMASFPEHGQRAADLLAAVRGALEVARTASGARLEYAGDVPPEPQAAEREVDQKSGILDELTGVLRADRLGTAMQKFVARVRKENRPVSAIYLAVDFFKQYQDHYSPQATDMILKGLADVLSRRTRESDLLARADESEFVVVMDASPEDAMAMAQRLSVEIKRIPFRVAQSSLKITISAGVAGFPDHTGLAQQIYEFAETAMAAAQAKGRSVCLMYQPSMRPRGTVHRPMDVF